MFRTLATTLTLLLIALPAGAKERTWTSADGRTMQAEFVREVDGVVTFLKDGKLVSVPLDKLSEKDQQIVRDLTMGKPLPEEDSPPATTTPGSTPAASSPAPPSSAKATDTPAAKITIEVRTWTDDRGNKTNAKFVRINGNDVVLNRSGKILTVSYHSLSEEDQQYVRDLLTQQGKEELIPSARAAPVAGGNSATGGAAPGPVTSGIPSSPFPPAGRGAPGGGLPMGPGGLGAGGAPPALPPGAGFPGGGFPGGGFPGGGFPGAGGAPEPPTVPSAGGVPVAGAPVGIDPIGMPAPGLPAGGMNPGLGSNPGFGGGSSVPSSFPEPSFPRQPMTPTFPTGPTFQQVFKCSGCSREISQEQSKLDRCPYCNTIWVYKEDGSGKKQMTAGGVRNMVIGVFVGIVVVVLGGVAGFIGIIVAIVRAVSRPSRPTYRQY